ncbi:MAG: AMP-binding protein [Acidimicrobiia bacterium]|nr:AMP-binding protein [Acidimicrobiia bacterium]MDH5238126.1 AMP-binding protein [Acidimicrobiia bacterium]
MTEAGREISVVAQRHPERPAVISDRGTLSFGQLDQQADALAAHFDSCGLAAGASLALLSTNRPEWLVTYQAALRSGLRLVPVNWHLEADDVAYMIADSGAQVVVVEADLVDLVPGDVARVVIGDESFAEVTNGGAHGPRGRPRGTLMIYTSGTTGRPKGVAHGESTSDGGAVGAAMVAMFGMDGDRGDTMLCPAPLYHSGPSRLCGEWPLGAGVPVVLMSRFDPREALELIQRHRITHAFFVPTMFHRMLALDDRHDYDVSSLRFVLHGAGPCPVATKTSMFDWFGPIIHEIYAASEGPGTWIGPEEWLAHPGSVGRTDPERLQIRTDDDGPAPAGVEGAVWFRASAPFRYHDDPDKTAATFDADGSWYTVGDRGRIDGDGYLFLTGRTTECIISGGVNLYPARIDDVLALHPALIDGAAFGLPDPELGEVVAAAVVPVDDRRHDVDAVAAEVVEFCRSHLGRQLTPRVVHVVDQLPRSDAGKLYRRRLVDSFRPSEAIAPEEATS